MTVGTGVCDRRAYTSSFPSHPFARSYTRFGIGRTCWNSATADWTSGAGCASADAATASTTASDTARRFSMLTSRYGNSGGGKRSLVACSKAYASSINFGSLHAIPQTLTPYGDGSASNPAGNGGVGAFGTVAKGTITVG